MLRKKCDGLGRTQISVTDRWMDARHKRNNPVVSAMLQGIGQYKELIYGYPWIKRTLFNSSNCNIRSLFYINKYGKI